MDFIQKAHTLLEETIKVVKENLGAYLSAFSTKFSKNLVAKLDSLNTWFNEESRKMYAMMKDFKLGQVVDIVNAFMAKMTATFRQLFGQDQTNQDEIKPASPATE